MSTVAEQPAASDTKGWDAYLQAEALERTRPKYSENELHAAKLAAIRTYDDAPKQAKRVLLREAERGLDAAAAPWMDKPLTVHRCEDILTEVAEEIDYLIPGFVPRGWAMKVAAREKGGKGTLVFYLLAQLEKGGVTVFSAEPAAPATSLIVTEEPPESVREKVERFGLRRSEVLYTHELPKELNELAPEAAWQRKCEIIVRHAAVRGHALIFTDNLSRLIGVEDEAGTEFARRAEYFATQCRREGLTWIADHHHRKSGGPVQDRSRGGTALGGMFDVNVDLEHKGDNPLVRTRHITSVGRVTATRWARTITLSEDGTGYHASAPTEDEHGSTTDASRLEKLRSEAADGATAAELAGLFDITPDAARRWAKEQQAVGALQPHSSKRGNATVWVAPPKPGF